MPTVPRSSQQRLETNPLPQARIQYNTKASDFGGDFAKGLGEVGEALFKEGIDQGKEREANQKASNAMRVLGADQKVFDWEMKRLHDPKSGYYAMKGGQAVGKGELLDKEFQQAVEDASKDLENDQQKTDFMKRMLTRARIVRRGIAKHEMQERSSYIDQGLSATRSQAEEHAALNYGDDDALNDALDRGAMSFYNKPGVNPAEAGAKYENWSSKTIKRNIELQMVEDPARANATFEKYKDRLTPSDLLTTSKGLKDYREDKDSSDAARQITNIGGSLSEKIAKVRQSDMAPDLQDQTIAKLKVFDKEKNTLMELQDKNVKDSSWKTVIDNPTIASIPPSASPAMKREMTAYIEKRMSGQAVASDPEALTQLDDMIVNDPTKFKKLSIVQMANRLSTADIQKYGKVQQEMTSGKGSTKRTQIMTVKNVVSGRVAQLGLNPRVQKDKTKIAMFNQAVQNEVDAWEEANAKKISPDEVAKITDRLILQGEVQSGSMFIPDKNKRLYELTPEERGAFRVDSMTTQEKSYVTDQLRMRKIPNTADNRAALFTLLKTSDKQGINQFFNRFKQK